MFKVLYISYTGLTEPLGRSQVLSYLQGLAKDGKYQFTVVSFENPKFYISERDKVNDYCIQSNIVWHPLEYNNKLPIVDVVMRLRTIKQVVCKLHRDQKFDLIHCRSYRSSIIGLWMKEKFRIPFIFDMRGFWADERVDGNIWNLKNPIYKLLYNYYKRKEKQLLLSADYTISLTENAKEEINRWTLKGALSPIAVIPCCVDLELFNRNSINKEKYEKYLDLFNINGAQFVLSYLGSLGTWYLLKEMLFFYKQLLLKYSDAVFLFITNEPPSLILEKATELNIPTKNIKVVAAKRDEVPTLLSLSTYSIFFIKPAFSKKASSPVKQGEIMALGIPIICNDSIGDTSEIVEKYKSGLVIDSFEMDSFDNKIREMNQLKFDSTNIINGAQNYFSLQSGVEKYSEVYRAILEK